MKKVLLILSLCWGLTASAQLLSGKALELNNPAGTVAPQYVSVPEGVWFNGNFTVESWVNLKSYDTWARLFDFSNGAGYDNIMFAFSDGNGYPSIPFRSGTAYAPNLINTKIPLNQWTHIALVVKDSLGIVYFNGVEVFNKKLPYLPKNVNRTQNYIGRSPWITDKYANMQIDEFRIFNKALTLEEIKASMDVPVVQTNDLILNYSFDSFEILNPTAVIDRSASQKNGTLVGKGSYFYTLPAPTGITVTDSSATGFSLKWDVVAGCSYKVVCAVDSRLKSFVIDDTLMKQANSGTCTFTGLPEGIKYYSVHAIKGIGDTPSEVDSVQTIIDYPGNAFNHNSTSSDSLPFYSGKGVKSMLLWAYLPKDNTGSFFISDKYGYSSLASNSFSRVVINGVDVDSDISYDQLPKDQWFSYFVEFPENITGSIYFFSHNNAGQIDELSFWSTALTDAQLKTYLHAAPPLGTAGLMDYYDFSSATALNGKTVVSAQITKYPMAFFKPSKAALTPFVRQISKVTHASYQATWDAIPNALGYLLESSANKQFTSATKVKTDKNNFTIASNLQCDSLYFRVRCFTENDTSEWSQTAFLQTSAIPGYAVKLTGTYSSNVGLPTIDWMAADFTIEAWVNLANYNHPWARLFEFGNGANSDNVLFALTDGTYKQQAISIRKGAVLWEYPIPVALPTNRWTHVAVTIDSTAANTGTVKVYYNGTVVFEKLCNILPNKITRTKNYIGFSSWNLIGAKEYTEASVDEFRIYDYPLSQDSIKARMHRSLQGNELGLQLYYNFDNRAALPLLEDLSGKQQNVYTYVNFEVSKAVIVPIIRKIDTVKASNKIVFAWDKIMNVKKYQVVLNNKDTLETLDTLASFVYGTRYANYYQVRAITNDALISDWSVGAFIDNAVTKPNNAYFGAQSITAKATAELQLPANHEITVAAWIKNFIPNDWSYIYQQDASTTGAVARAFYITETGNVRVGQTSYGTVWQNFTCPIALDSSQWNHVAFTQTNDSIHIYVNGIPCKGVIDDSKSINNKLTPVHYAATASSANYRMKLNLRPFKLDDVQFIGRALSASEIVRLSHTAVSDTTKDLLMGFDFNQADGSIIPDVAKHSDASTTNDINSWVSSTAEYTNFIRSVSDVTDSTFSLRWDSVPGATSYKLQYGTDKTFASTQTLTLNKASVRLNKLFAATNYFVRLKTIMPATESVWTATTTVTTTSLTDSLIAYYPFDNSLESLSGKTPALSATGIQSYIPNRLYAPSKACHLAEKEKMGELDYSKTAYNNLGEEFTAALWFNVKNLQNGTLISKLDYIEFKGYSIGLNIDGTIGVYIKNKEAKTYTDAKAKYHANQWNFVLVRRTKDGQLNVLLNDTLVINVANCDTAACAKGNFRFGDWNGTAPGMNGYNPDAPQFVGDIDDARLYHRAISNAEASSLFHEMGWPYVSAFVNNAIVYDQKNAGAFVGKIRALSAYNSSMITGFDYKKMDSTCSYTLVRGEGSADNTKFEIKNGNELYSKYIFDITQQQFAQLRVLGLDSTGKVSFESPFIVMVMDTTKAQVYDFEKLKLGAVTAQDSWDSVQYSLSGLVDSVIFDFQSKTKAFVANAKSSFSSANVNKIDNLFKTNRIHNDLSAQYILSFDVKKPEIDATFALLSDVANKEQKQNKIISLVLSRTLDLVTINGKEIPFLNQVPNEWAQVEISLSDLNKDKAKLSIRTRTLSSAYSSWIPVLGTTEVAIDSTKEGAINNPKLWNGILLALNGGDGAIDNISIRKRIMNPNRTTLAADLIAHFKMDTPYQLIDDSGNELNATPVFNQNTGSYIIPTAITDRLRSGNALTLNGATFSTPSLGSKLNAEEFTLSLWANMADASSYGGNFAAIYSTNFMIAACYGNSLFFNYGGNPISAYIPSTTRLTDWNHFVFVSSKKENATRIYLNNKCIATQTGAGTLNPSPFASLLIGDNNFTGSMDDMRVYGRALNNTEIAQLYTEGGWPVQGITLPSTIYLQANQSLQVPLSLQPADAPTTGLLYSVANTSVVSVDENGKITAGAAEGTTTLTVSTAGGSASATTTVQVTTTTAKITNIAIIGKKDTLLLNGNTTSKLAYKFYPKKAITSGIHWASNNQSVATIGADGLLSIKEKGNVCIYLYADSAQTVKDSFLLTVLPSAQPKINSNSTAQYYLQATTKKNNVWQAKDTAIIAIPQFFADDDSLTYTVSPLSAWNDTLQIRVLGTDVFVYQYDTIAPIKPLQISITATDKDKQSVTKNILLSVLTKADEKPVIDSLPKVDTLLQFRKTARFDLRKYIHDDYTAFERLGFDSLTINKRDSLSIAKGIITLMIRPLKTDNAFKDTLAFKVIDGKKQVTVVRVPYVFKRVTNKAPLVNVGVDTLKQTTDTVFTIDLAKSKTTDDYTPLKQLTWSIDKASNINAILNGTQLQLSASSSAWSGNEKIYVRATDEAGAIGVDSIVLVQKVDVNLTGIPQVDFVVTLDNGSTIPAIVAKGTKIKAIIIDKSKATIAVNTASWTISGAQNETFTGQNNCSFTCNALGTISIKLVAENGSGQTVVRHTAVVSVVGLKASKQKVCTDSTVVLSVNDSTTGTSFKWEGLSETTPSVQLVPAKTTTYKVTVSKQGNDVTDTLTVAVLSTPSKVANDTTLCANDSIRIAPTAFSKILWNGVQKNSFTAKAGTTIAVQAWVDATCPATKQTISVASKPVPNTELPAKFALCNGLKDTLVAKGGVKYEWNKATVKNDTLFVNEDGTFIVTVTAENKCVTIDTVQVSLGSKPTVTASASATKVCEKGIVTLTATSPDPSVTYKWNTNLLADGTTTANVVGNNDFYVTATNQAGCQEWDSVRVKVAVAAPLSIAVMPNDSVCLGTQLSFTASGATSYKWSDELGNAAAVSAKPTATKTFMVTATKDQCTQRDTVRIVVHQLPIVTATPSSASVCRKASVTLNGGGAKTYKWDNNVVDGQAFTLAQSSKFTVTGTDANGCVNTAQANVTLIRPYREQLGVVTFDSITAHKLIVAWNPTKGKNIASYVLYRFNDATAGFDSLKRFSPSDSTYYVDAAVDAKAQSYTYKIATRDSVCNDTTQSTPHTSVHLTASLGAETPTVANLSWNPYSGITVDKYHVSVYNAQNKLVKVIDKADNKVERPLTYSYDAHQTGNKYRITFDLPATVFVSRLKSDTGPFSQSLSNMSEANLVDIAAPEAALELNAYPNPANNDVSILGKGLAQAQTLQVTDSKGTSHRLTVTTATATEIKLSVKALLPGLYSVQVPTAAGLKVVKLMVE